MIAPFKERLKPILGVGIEHCQQHADDLRGLAEEARTQGDARLAEALLEAAHLSQALASKLKEIAKEIG
jgi:hypothetical protein